MMIFIDSHVHIYPNCDLSRLFDNASDHFTDVANGFGHKEQYQAVLVLTEPMGSNFFYQLHVMAQQNISISRWHIQLTDEAASLRLNNEDTGKNLYLIAGCQLVTTEGIEVLGIGTRKRFKKKMNITRTITSLKAAGALVALPWGVGKWLGKRGKLIKTILASHTPQEIFIGDNGGRPVFWGRPILFKIAARRGYSILPGSDPLPLPFDYYRAGSFGFGIKGSINRNNPLCDFKTILTDPKFSPLPYGDLMDVKTFLKNRLALHKRNRG